MTACQFFSHCISKQTKRIQCLWNLLVCISIWKIYFCDRESTVSSNQICTSPSFPCWKNVHV